MKQFVLDVFTLENVLKDYQKQLYEIKIKINATSFQDLNTLIGETFASFANFGLFRESLSRESFLNGNSRKFIQ